MAHIRLSNEWITKDRASEKRQEEEGDITRNEQAFNIVNAAN